MLIANSTFSQIINNVSLGLVEIPCPFDDAQDMLKTKEKFVMPANYE
jgi:hypothetical protein